MPLIYYWRWDNYQTDLDLGVGFHLNQASPRLHSAGIGDSLWAFTRRPDGAYVLAAELVIRARTLNRPGYRYGAYRVWGDLGRSRYFSVAEQAPLDPIVRALSLEVRARYLGQAFQGKAAVRRITPADHSFLARWAEALVPEPRARLIPEERLEALALAGDREGVERLLLPELPGMAAERRAYLYGTTLSKVRSHSQELRARYGDRCQLCGWTAAADFDCEVAEAHHLQWLSRGGRDSLDNLVLLCPNHHRVVHRCDAVLDYRDLAMVFGEAHRRALLMPGHLAA